MSEEYNIMDIKGILHYKDIPLIDFEISRLTLVYVKDLSEGKYYPWEFAELGLTYGAFNVFFNDRVVRNHTQWIRDYLDFLGLKYYDFNAMIKKMNGWDAVGNVWVKFPDIGAKSWYDIQHQKYPIY